MGNKITVRDLQNFTLCLSENLDDFLLAGLINKLCSKYPGFGIVFFDDRMSFVINNDNLFVMCDVEDLYLENILMGVICIENEKLSNYIV